MAIFHLSVKTVARSKGQSATASAAYRAAEKIKDERTGELHDYTRKKGVIEAALILPKGVPKMERGELWNAAEAAENRKNSTVGREYEVALPAELTADERLQLAKDFAGWLVERYGVAADVAIHEPNRRGDEKNFHAHILTTTRRIERDGLGEKTRQLDDKKSGEVEKIRERWEQMCNHELSRKGENEISRQSLKAQGVTDRLPQIHVGAAAMAMERKGKTSLRYRRNQAIKDLPVYQAQLAELQNALASAADIPPSAARTPIEAPSLKNAVELSPDEADLLLRASTAQIEKKPLEDYSSRRVAEKKELEKRHESSRVAYLEISENVPKKGILEFVGFEKRLQAWEKTAGNARNEYLTYRDALSNHDKETAAGRKEIHTAALEEAMKKHPEAVKVLERDEERKKVEQEQQREQRKIQRELQRKNRGRSLGR